VDNVAALTAQILAGDFDGHLIDISRALQARVSTGEVAVRWRLAIDEIAITEDDLTLDEFFRWERVTARNWRELRPLASASDCRALLGVLAVTRLGKTPEDADTWVAALPARQVLESFAEFEVTEAPLDSPGSSTT
jgi:hypothetical protein